jgi:hypothetical protein
MTTSYLFTSNIGSTIPSAYYATITLPNMSIPVSNKPVSLVLEHTGETIKGTYNIFVHEKFELPFEFSLKLLEGSLETVNFKCMLGDSPLAHYRTKTFSYVKSNDKYDLRMYETHKDSGIYIVISSPEETYEFHIIPSTKL